MSHITIIISKVASPVETQESALGVSYEYCIPVPHDATPKKVGEMVARAYRHLEGELVSSEQAIAP